jgi:GntR family transcriptional regulator
LDSLERRTPHYLRIYRDLKTRIVDGAWAPGERLPTQREVANSFGVTLMTVRQALQLLEQEELVVMRHGLGTFVAPHRVRYAMGNLRSLAQEVTAQGLELKTRVLGRDLAEPHPHVAELLHLEPGEPVFSIERLRFVGLEPIVYQHSQLLPSIGAALLDVDLSNISLYDHLQGALKIELARAQERIHAIALPAREAALLEEEPGAAALLSERVTFSTAGDPIMFDRAFMHGDRVSVANDRFVSDVTVGYELRLSKEGSLT